MSPHVVSEIPQIGRNPIYLATLAVFYPFVSPVAESAPVDAREPQSHNHRIEVQRTELPEITGIASLMLHVLEHDSGAQFLDEWRIMRVNDQAICLLAKLAEEPVH